MESSREKAKRTMLYAALFVYIFGSSVVLNQNTTIQLRSDIFQRWYATNKLLEEGRNIYDSQNGVDTLRYAWGNASPLGGTNFYYPATLLLFTVPLALLPYPAAHMIWTMLTQLFFFAGVFFVVRLLRYPPTANQLAFLACILFGWIPYIQHMIWGQFNTIGMLFLALCLFALYQDHFGWAGVFFAGLTFKPHTTLLTFVFLLFWILFQEKRWRFILGFVVSSLLLWAFAEAFQPGWVFDFFRSLGGYESVSSALDQVWNPAQILSIVLVGGSMGVFLWKRHANFRSPAFAGCLILSLAVWALVVPVTGSFHLLPVSIAILFLLSHYFRWEPSHYSKLIWTLLSVYCIGWVGFVWGLSKPEWYGLHIRLSEATNNFALPLIIIFFAIPLLRWRDSSQEPVGCISANE
jgi:hypothetical protein